MDISIQHSVTYSTVHDVPVSVVARSLLANESLVIASIRTLERCTPGLGVTSISVRVAELSNSSPLRELLIATLVVSFQKDLVEEVPDLIEKLSGYNVPENCDTLVTVMVVATALYAICTAIERVIPGKSAKKLIEEYERKKERISELSGIDKEVLEKYTSERIGTDKTFFKHALDFFAPARLEPGAALLLPNGDTVSADVIAEIPTNVDVEPRATNVYELRGALVDIHRSDRDENKHGWRAVIESVSDKKVRMELAPTIAPETLYGKTSVIADVAVVEDQQPDGSYNVKLYQLTNVLTAPVP